ncbi:PREDICTED: nuclear protein MDM1 [Chrysochloris asiatica]|uniref:Nuclear protein MDM1 n=1 Tax=Chrysochloris asiatica TaxID=185453 RepID=A0A9B0TFG3_CHRAS|nr:PREDICTED: nuclear protein MDM1 [Chrysochloris asiatica]
MPVRFKGLSEYQRNFLWKKSYLSESHNPSVGQKYPWAGLRSDQLGITKEPSFISKRRVPYYDPQISKSLEWKGSVSENNVVVSPEPEAPVAQEAEQKNDVNQEKDFTLDVSRVPKRTRSHSMDSRAEGALDLVEHEDKTVDPRAVNENVQLEHSAKLLSEKVDNGVGICNKKDDPLKSEAVMESKDSVQPEKMLTPWRHQRLGKVNSEYRAKFLSPAQYLYKAGAWTHIKENMPNQGSLNAMWYAEVKELREKAEFYRKRVLGTHFSRDHLNQLLSDNNCCWDVSSASSEGTHSSNIRALDLAGDPTSHQTLKKCHSTKLDETRPTLDEQPSKYATEKLGMSGTATMPVRRRLAWDADNTNEEPQKQPTGKEEEEESERDRQVYREELEKLEVNERSKANKRKDWSDSSSVSSGQGGRLPTPQLRELGGAQRTHHDRTTPAVGGAVLVSPSKVKVPVPEQRKNMLHQDCLEASKKDFSKVKLGKAKMNDFQLPQHDAFNDEDDRLSEISARSAASSLRAFQTLARAKKRKEKFWGKT